MAVRVFTVVLVWLPIATVGATSTARGDVGGAIGFVELTEVAQLGPSAYVARRDELLLLNWKPWDVQRAAEHSWEAGLVALILNARRAAPEAAAKWDALEPESNTRMAGVWRYDLGKLGEGDYQVFGIEELWRPRQRTIAYFGPSFVLQQSLPGPVELWYAVWLHSGVKPLRHVAIHGIASDTSPRGRDTLRAIIEGESATVEEKGAVLGGLRMYQPDYSTDLLLETADHWRADNRVEDGTVTQPETDAVRRTIADGIRKTLERNWLQTLAMQSDARASKFLRAIACDRDDPLRAVALEACALNPQPEDLLIIRSVLYGPDSPKPAAPDMIPLQLQRLMDKNPGPLKTSMVDLLRRYPIDMARPLIHEVLRDPPAPEVFWYLVRSLPDDGYRLAPQERDLLQELQRADNVPELAREEVSRVLGLSTEAEQRKASSSPPEP